MSLVEEFGMSDPAALPTFPRYRIKKSTEIKASYRVVEVQEMYCAPWVTLGVSLSEAAALDKVRQLRAEAKYKAEQAAQQAVYDREAIYL